MIAGALLLLGGAIYATYTVQQNSAEKERRLQARKAALKARAARQAEYDSCFAAYSPVLAKLKELESKTDVGLNFSQHSELVQDAKVSFDAINKDAVSPRCYGDLNTSVESAVDSYIEASQLWNKCIFQDDTCDTDSDEFNRDLNAKWLAVRDLGRVELAERSAKRLLVRRGVIRLPAESQPLEGFFRVQPARIASRFC